MPVSLVRRRACLSRITARTNDRDILVSAETIAAHRAAARGWASAPADNLAYIITAQDAGAVDGFTIMGSTLPYELRAFTEHVVPILQARGRYRAEYTGHTRRDHLGLDHPAGYRMSAGHAAGRSGQEIGAR